MKFKLDDIENLDRRFIFVLVLIAVVVPLLLNIKMDVGVTKQVENIYNYVDTLPKGSIIWMGFDYYNSTRTECNPAAKAFLRHCFRKEHKIFVTSTIPDGDGNSKNIVKAIAAEFGKEYGKDYVILGYKPGGSIIMLQICRNIRGLFNTDAYGTPIDEIPMMSRVKNYKDIGMLFTVTDNASFDQYVQVASTQYHIPMAGASTAVSVPLYYVYINSGQAIGVLGGLKGAAEYEKLIGVKGTATEGMVAQSFVHLFIVIMILLSNIIYFKKKFSGQNEMV